MNQTLLKSAILLFGIIFLSIRLQATAYYISPAGSDANAGTSALFPWQTISKVNGINILPGDSILFEGGQTFNGHIVIDANDANDSTNIVTFASYGIGKAIINSADTIGFYAFNTQGFIVSNIIFEGSGMHANNTDGIYLYADLDGDVKFTNITFSYVEIFNYGGIGLEVGAWPDDAGNTGFKNILMDSVHVHDVLSSGIEMWGYFDTDHIGWSHRNTLIRNTLVNNVPGFPSSGWKGSGIVIAQVDSGVMEHCVAHDNGTGNTACGGPVGIWAWDCNNITIQFCESYHNSSGSGCDGGGFDFDGGETNSLLQYNYSHDNDGSGFLLGQFDYARPWFNNVVRFNISENDGRTNSGGITLFKAPTSTMSGSIIYNNTVYVTPSINNSTVGAFNIVDWDPAIDSTVVYNNIFQTTGDVLLVDIPAGYSASFAGNLYWASGGAFGIQYDGTLYHDLDTWRTATGNEKTGSTSTGIIADPLLENAGNGGAAYPNATTQLNAYQLPGNSPAMNSGLDLINLFGIDAGSHDYFGNPIPFSAHNVGAYDYSILTSIKAAIANTKNRIYLYPNPASDKIHVVDYTASAVLDIYNALGMKIFSNVLEKSSSKQEAEIDVSAFSPGVYFLRLTGDVTSTSLKVIKQ